MNLRVARLSDAEALFQVQKTSALEAYMHVFPPERYAFPDEAERAKWHRLLSSPEFRVLIAEQDRTVGVAVAGNEYLERLFVIPEKWGRGVGTMLHDHVIEILISEGTEVAKLWVLEENERARAFYERKAWHPDGRTRRVAFPPYPIELGYSLSLL